MNDRWPEAFSKAEQARSAIDQLVEQVETEALDAHGAFAAADADPLAGRTFTVKVLEVLPGVGKVKSRRTLASLGIDAEAPVSSLATDDRQRIVDAFASL